MSPPLPPRLSFATHLGLYATFHQSAGNRVVHAVGTPLVLISGQLLLSALTGPLHGGPALTIAACLFIATYDRRTAGLTALWLLPLSLLADRIATLPWAWLAGAVVHGVAWLLVTKLGHVALEPSLEVQGAREDSNYYFRQGFFVGRNLGLALHPADRLLQFAVAPFALTVDALSSVGFLRELTAAVDARRSAVHARVRRGLPPLQGLAS